jgi:hypothetical protein
MIRSGPSCDLAMSRNFLQLANAIITYCIQVFFKLASDPGLAYLRWLTALCLRNALVA